MRHCGVSWPATIGRPSGQQSSASLLYWRPCLHLGRGSWGPAEGCNPPWLSHTANGRQRQSIKAEVLYSSPRAPPRSTYFACLSLLTHLIQIISSLEVRSMHELCSDWHAPYTVSIAPYTESIAPYTGSIAPYTGSVAPYTESIAPYTGSIAPYTGSIAPYTGSIAPYTGSIAPYTGSIAPYTGSIAPYSLSREIRWSLLYFRNIHSWICAARRLHARTSVTSYTSVNIYNFNSRLAHFNALWMEYIRSLRTGIMEEYPVMSTSQGTYVRIEQTSEAIRVTYEICRAGGHEDWNWEPLN